LKNVSRKDGSWNVRPDAWFAGLKELLAGGMEFIAGQGAAKVSLNEKGKNYIVTASIPGARENDINVHLSGRLLTLSTHEQGSSTQHENNGQVSQQEQYSSSFEQAFTLPGPVNASGMQSHFKDGVLILTIPKANA
jgi:HSP20 family protein